MRGRQITKALSRLLIRAIPCFLSAHLAVADEVTLPKTIAFQIGTSAGGGYDLYARTFAEFLPKYLPGNPRVIVQYVVGAAGVTLTNQIFNTAPSDGSVIAMVPASIVLFELLEPSGVQFRSRELAWIGTLSTETNVTGVLKSTGVDSLDAAKKQVITVGATGRIGNVSIYPLLSNAVLGTKFKVIYGYPGSNEINLAVDNGEVQGRTNEWVSWKSQRPNWIKEDKMKFLFQTGHKNPELVGVPALDELITDPDKLNMVKAVEIIDLIGRSIFTSPKISPERLQIFRQAFAQASADPAYLKRMAELGLDTFSRPWSALQADLDSAAKLPPESKAALIKMVNQ